MYLAQESEKLKKLRPLWTQLLLHANKVRQQISDNTSELQWHLVPLHRPLKHKKYMPPIILNILLISPVYTWSPDVASYLLHPNCLHGLSMADSLGLLSSDHYLGPIPASFLGPDPVVPVHLLSPSYLFDSGLAGPAIYGCLKGRKGKEKEKDSF